MHGVCKVVQMSATDISAMARVLKRRPPSVCLCLKAMTGTNGGPVGKSDSRKVSANMLP